MRYALATFCLAACLALAPGRAAAGPALVFDAGSGEVLHAHAPFQPWHPASLAKLMTLYLVFAAIEDGRVSADSPVPLSERAVAVTANASGFAAGTELTMAEAIEVLAVLSANDVAVAVAEALAGDVDAFVAEMNAVAERLGMSDTRFTNPHGLHDAAQITTARDTALLARALIARFPDRLEPFARTEGEVRGRPLRSFNRLIGRFSGADGLKTGFVCASGYNMVASATREGRRLVAVMLGALSEDQRAEVAAGLLEAGFADADTEGGDLDSLSPPDGAPEPVDMRPYTCGDRRPPPDLASFGMAGIGADPPLPPERPAR